MTGSEMPPHTIRNCEAAPWRLSDMTASVLGACAGREVAAVVPVAGITLRPLVGAA